MVIDIKRIYEKPADEDGLRILVDRLWPRGMSRKKAGIDVWLKDAAPSTELRKWFNHDPERWDEFKSRYFEELNGRDGLNRAVSDITEKDKITLLFSSRDEKFNNAAALKEYIEKYRLRSRQAKIKSTDPTFIKNS